MAKVIAIKECQKGILREIVENNEFVKKLSLKHDHGVIEFKVKGKICSRDLERAIEDEFEKGNYQIIINMQKAACLTEKNIAILYRFREIASHHKGFLVIVTSEYDYKRLMSRYSFVAYNRQHKVSREIVICHDIKSALLEGKKETIRSIAFNSTIDKRTIKVPTKLDDEIVDKLIGGEVWEMLGWYAANHYERSRIGGDILKTTVNCISTGGNYSTDLKKTKGHLRILSDFLFEMQLSPYLIHVEHPGLVLTISIDK